jgi:sugar-specific transcriptional regulator TrmB
MLNQFLDSLALPKNAKQIYVRLLEAGPQPVRNIAENLHIPRPSAYDNLKVLMQHGLVVERTEKNKKVFQVDDIQRLPQIVEQKIDNLKKLHKDIIKSLPSLVKQAHTTEPRINFYSGREGIKNVLRDLLWHENIETLTMWPIKDMVDLVGREYLEELNRKRIRKQISIRGIWPQSQLVDLHKYQFLGVGPKHLRTMHLAPAGVTWPMSYWLYADKVAFISSKRECFSFLVTSADFVDLMRVQFEFIWKATKLYKSKQYVDSFLPTV